MDSVDNFESANARAWDETSHTSNPALKIKPTEVADVVPRTGHGKHSSQPFDPSSRAAEIENSLDPQSEWHHTQLDLSNVKATPSPAAQQIREATNPCQGNSFLNPKVRYQVTGSSRRPIFQCQKGKISGQWAVTPGLVTYRKQAELDKEAQKAIEEEVYLNPAPPGLKQRVIGHYLVLSNDVLQEQLLGEHLDKIRTTCKVYVEHDVTYRSLTVRSNYVVKVLEAMARIKAATLHLKVEADTFTPLYIVEPPTVSAMTLDVCPVYANGGPDESLINHVLLYNIPAATKKAAGRSDSKIAAENFAAPIVNKVVQSGRRLSDREIHEWADERNELIVANGNLILEYILRSFQNLCGLQSRMRLRVHFGHLEIHHYQKSFQNPGIPYRSFVKMMGSSRTKALFNKRISDQGFASRLVRQIQVSPDCFSPVDALTSSLVDVKPKQIFVMFALAPSNQLIRVEADIDAVNDGSKNKYQIGTTNYYLHSARKTRLEVGVMNFESEYDWSLELVTNDFVNAVPEAFQQLVGSCVRTSSVEKIDQYGFSYPEIIVVEQPGLTVVDARIKTALQYRLTGTSYVVELSIYRVCNGSQGVSSLPGSLGVSFFSTDWDVSMGLIHGPAPDRELGLDLKGLCPFTPNSSSFMDFLVRLKEFQARLTRVSSYVD